jgi:ABC-type glycerol-3-phosphate transport system substrate-binding protein
LDDPWFNSPAGADFAFALKYLDESKKNVFFPVTWERLMDNLATAAQQVVAGQKSPVDALSAVAKEFDSWKS